MIKRLHANRLRTVAGSCQTKHPMETVSLHYPSRFVWVCSAQSLLEISSYLPWVQVVGLWQTGKAMSHVLAIENVNEEVAPQVSKYKWLGPDDMGSKVLRESPMLFLSLRALKRKHVLPKENICVFSAIDIYIAVTKHCHCHQVCFHTTTDLT